MNIIVWRTHSTDHLLVGLDNLLEPPRIHDGSESLQYSTVMRKTWHCWYEAHPTNILTSSADHALCITSSCKHFWILIAGLVCSMRTEEVPVHLKLTEPMPSLWFSACVCTFLCCMQSHQRRSVLHSLWAFFILQINTDCKHSMEEEATAQ